MVEDNWNPWKLTAIAMSFLMMIALVAGLVVSNWSGPEPRGQLERSGARTGAVSSLPRPVARDPSAPVPAASEASQADVPPLSAIELCNEYAAGQASHRDKTLEVEKNPASEAVVGTPVGAAGAGAGTLYGLNENRKNDERYREAYRACMRLRGYAG